MLQARLSAASTVYYATTRSSKLYLYQLVEVGVKVHRGHKGQNQGNHQEGTVGALRHAGLVLGVARLSHPVLRVERVKAKHRIRERGEGASVVALIEGI
jgi:hypothetical protein